MEHCWGSSSTTVLRRQMDLILARINTKLISRTASVAGRDLVEYIIGVVIPVYTIHTHLLPYIPKHTYTYQNNPIDTHTHKRFLIFLYL